MWMCFILTMLPLDIIVFSQCNGDLGSYAIELQGITAGLFHYKCSYCNIEDIYFFGYGFAGVNLFLNSNLNNININMTVVRTGAYMWSPKSFVMFEDTEYYHDYYSISINQVSISGYSEFCYGYGNSMEIQLWNSHSIQV